jgi:hypothetical protein
VWFVTLREALKMQAFDNMWCSEKVFKCYEGEGSNNWWVLHDDISDLNWLYGNFEESEIKLFVID